MNNNQTVSVAAIAILSSMILIACTLQVGDVAINSPSRIIGSGKVVSAERNIRGANAVLIAGSGVLNIKVGSEESLNISADDNLLPYLTSDVSNGKLVLGTKPLTSITTRNPIIYNLQVEDLSAVELVGSAKINGSGVNSDRLRVVISGSGEVKLDGQADQQDVTISGSGTYNAPDLESHKVSVSVPGSGSVVVRVSDNLNALISGSGSIEYIGNPKVEKTIWGSGSVKQR